MICPNCKKEVEWIPNEKVYGKRYGRSFMCYYCFDCDYYVGCHNNTREPLGTMADRETRQMRNECHKLFDRLWKENHFTRKQSYEWIQRKMGKTKNEAHIGMFSKKECIKLLKLIESKIHNYK